MVKVSILSTVHNALDTRIFFREAKSLQKAGYQVTLIAQYPEKREVIDGILIAGLPVINNRFQRFLLGWRAFWKAIRLQSDVYHFHDPELILVGVFLRLWTRKPVIYDVHEFYPDAIMERRWIPSPLKGVLSWFFDVLEKACAGFFSAIITADEEISNRFQGRGFPVQTIYNFPERHYFFGEDDNFDEPEKYNTQLIYVGSLTAQRGLWVMLEMMEILLEDYQLDVGLWLVGKIGDEKDRKELERRLSDQSKLQRRVTFVGWVPFDQLPSYLRSSDIGLVPLLPIPKFYKNIPTKQFEYMAAGLPVVGSDLPPIRKFLEESQAGIVAAPGDPTSFAEKVAYLIRKPVCAAEMGLYGKKATKEQYNWKSEEIKLIELYQALLQ